METIDILLVLGICICLIPWVVFIPERVKPLYGFLLSSGMAFSSFLLILKVYEGGELEYFVATIPITGALAVQMDLLSASFMMIVNFTCLMAGFYSMGSLPYHKNGTSLNMYVIGFGFLHAGMLMVCMFQNLFMFLISWELMSLASFLLIVYNYQQKGTLRAGMNYLIQMHIGVLFLIFAALILYKETGEMSFSSLALYFEKQPVLPLFLLFYIGFGFKAGFIVLHSWLAPAYQVSPAQVLAVMSGVMMKMALYGILRVLLYVPNSHLEIGVIIMSVGILSALYGILNAIVSKSLKQVLGFSSIENIGIICMGLGMGFIGIGLHNPAMAFLGLVAGMMHIFNHSLFKPLLLLSAGSVQLSTKTTNIERLGALIKKMPYTATLFLLGAMAIAGLPPLNGFVSEFLLYQGIFKGLNSTNVLTEVILLTGMSSLAVLGGLSIYAFSKAFGLSFLGVARSQKAVEAKEVGWLMLAPQFLIFAVMLSLAIFPSFYFQYFALIADMYLDVYDSRISDASVLALENDDLLSIIFIAMVIVLYTIRTYIVKQNKPVYNARTWGCGYLAGNSRMQYTSNSFAFYATKLVKNLVGYKIRYNTIPKNDIFPSERNYQVEHEDVIGENLLNKPIDFVTEVMKKLAFIETGKTQSYILYAFLFILGLFLMTYFNVF